MGQAFQPANLRKAGLVLRQLGFAGLATETTMSFWLKDRRDDEQAPDAYPKFKLTEHQEAVRE